MSKYGLMYNLMYNFWYLNVEWLANILEFFEEILTSLHGMRSIFINLQMKLRHHIEIRQTGKRFSKTEEKKFSMTIGCVILTLVYYHTSYSSRDQIECVSNKRQQRIWC